MSWVLLYGAAAASSGWLYLSLGSRRREVPTVDRAVLALPAGVLLVGIVTFVVSWPLGVRFTRISILACAVGLALVLLAGVRVGVPAVIRPNLTWRRDRATFLLLAFGGLVVLTFSVWMSALYLNRPIHGYDFYLYHWHFARIAFESGRLPTEVSPSWAENQYAFPPLLFLVYAHLSHLLGHFSQIGPRLLPFLFAIASVLVAGRIARVCLKLSLPASLCAAAFALWGTFYINHMWEENTEAPNAFWTLAAAYWLLRRDISPWSRGLGGGLMLAGAYWSRYNGLAAFGVLAMVLAATALWDRIAGRPWKGEALVAGGGVLVGLLLIAPHLGRNLLLLGNPLYPAFARSLGGYLVDPWVLRESLSVTTAVPFFGLPPLWWIQPFESFPYTGPTLAILAAALFPAWRLLRRGNPHALQLLLAAALYFLLYLIFMRLPIDGDFERHLLPLVSFAAPLAGLIFEEVTRRSWLALFTAGALGALLGGYAVGNHLLRRENLVLALLVFGVLLVTRSRALAGRLPGSMRLDLLPLFLWPFLVMGLWTGHPDSDPAYPVRDGLWQFPEAGLMSTFDPHDKVLTFERRREMLAGEPFPGDHPRLERFYAEQLDGPAGVRELRRLGVRYIHWTKLSPLHPITHPLELRSPLYQELDDPRLFRRIYYSHDELSTVAIYALLSIPSPLEGEGQGGG